jgi:hypothetical protein
MKAGKDRPVIASFSTALRTLLLGRNLANLSLRAVFAKQSHFRRAEIASLAEGRSLAMTVQFLTSQSTRMVRPYHNAKDDLIRK